MPNELDEALNAFEPIAPADTSGESAGNDMQEALRKSGARRLPGDGPESYQTNQGTVIFGTPQDQKRLHILQNSKALRPRFDRDGNPYRPMGLPRTLTHDPELDIDWGIHKVTEPVTGPVIGSVGGEMAQYYGRCRGGPYNAKQMTHGAAVYRIAFDKNNPLRGLPGQQASTVDVEALFGNYVFDQERCEWNWDETSISESRETA